MGSLWWTDPFFEKDDPYRYVFHTEGGYSVNDKTILWVMNAIKANVSNRATTNTERKAKEDAVREIEKTLKRFLK